MTTRFKNALDALVYAFFNDTLRKGDCAACAVGNIITWADGDKSYNGNTVKLSHGCLNSDWGSLFMTVRYLGVSEQRFDTYNPQNRRKVVNSIEATGYTLQEMARVEYAFETNSNIHWIIYDQHTKEEIMQDQFNALCAVVDTLCEIEGIEDPAEYKELFTLPA